MGVLYKDFSFPPDSLTNMAAEEKIFRNRPIRNKNYLWCVVTMLVNGSGQNEQSLQRTFHRYFLPRFGSFAKVVSEEKLF
jgi:hypothetical protein